MFTCEGCDHTWTGLLIAHCAACHETFTTVQGFDRHRDSDHCRRPKFARRSDGLALYAKSASAKDAWFLASYDTNGVLKRRCASWTT